MPGISWGDPAQGLQAGLKYVRGMQADSYNDPSNWNWQDGQTVESAVVVRNISSEPLTISWLPAVDSEHMALEAGDSSVTDYDTFGGIKPRRSVEIQHESERQVSKTLEPGEFVTVARSDFEFTDKTRFDEHRKDLPRVNRMLLEEDHRYWYQTRVAVHAKSTTRISLQTGKLRLWAGIDESDQSPSSQLKIPNGTGSIRVRHGFAASPKSSLALIPLQTGKSQISFNIGTENDIPINCASGHYRIAREINLQSGPLSHAVKCNVREVAVIPDQTVLVDYRSETEHRVAAHGWIDGYQDLNLAGAFVQVYRNEDDRYDTGDPVRYFDFLALRDPIAAAAVDEDGKFTIEPLPDGSYVVSIAAFRIVLNKSHGEVVVSPRWVVGCATFRIFAHSDEAHWYPNTPLKLINQWNEPIWKPSIGKRAVKQTQATSAFFEDASETTPDLSENTELAQPKPEAIEAVANKDANDSEYQIINTDGKPVVGATVRLIVQPRTYRDMVEHKVLHTTTTDKDGRFELPEGRQAVDPQGNDTGGYSATWVTVPATDNQPERTWLLGTSAGGFSPYFQAITKLVANPQADLKDINQLRFSSQITKRIHPTRTENNDSSCRS